MEHGQHKELTEEQSKVLEPIAFEKLKEGLDNCEAWAVQLFFYYRYGR